MPKAAVSCPTCHATSWTTSETGKFERVVTFYTDEEEMEYALDFGEPGTPDYTETDTVFGDAWTCIKGHEADSVLNAYINGMLEEEADDDDDEDEVH